MKVGKGYPEEVVANAAEGDERALLALLELAQGDVRRFARRACMVQDVEDAVQESLWILYRKVGGLRTMATLTGWLFTVVKRECLRLALRSTRMTTTELDETTFEQKLSTTPVDDLRIDLARALSRLSEEHRKVLILCDMQEWKVADAASHLGISLAGAKSRLHRARAHVRELLGRE